MGILNTILITTPLEQFNTFPVIALRFFDLFSFSVSQRELICSLLVLFIFFYMRALFLSSEKHSRPLIIANRWQSLYIHIQKIVMSLVVNNIKDKKGFLFFPVVFLIFTMILGFNLIGLIPYSYTVTTNLLFTFFVSLSAFIGINIKGYQKYGIKFFETFLPSGTSIELAFLLVPIEFMSYFFRPISLALRLFANMMAGHILLKVIAGFSVILFSLSGISFLLGFFPLLILVPLYGLELAVAFIQTFVFSILVCMYINDALNLH